MIYEDEAFNNFPEISVIDYEIIDTGTNWLVYVNGMIVFDYRKDRATSSVPTIKFRILDLEWISAPKIIRILMTLYWGNIQIDQIIDLTANYNF